MTKTTDKGKRSRRGVKKLSLKKETVKDLAVGPEKGKGLGDDELDAVNGGRARNALDTVAFQACLQPKPKCFTRPTCVAPTQPPTECLP